MTAPMLTVLCNCAVCVLAFCHNNLKERSKITMETRKVHVDDDWMPARLSYRKGHRAGIDPLACIKRVSANVTSPLGLLKE